MQLIHSWYISFRAKLQAIACYFGYTAEEAEDIVHQFFLDLLQKSITDNIQNPEAYLVTAFKRKLIDLHRRNQHKESPYKIESFYIPSTQEIIEQLETNEHLVNYIAEAYKKLPARYRKVIYMKYYKGYTTEKIVSLTGFTHQTVYNNLSKGIQHLRQNLNKERLFSKLASFIFFPFF
ncbi:MAG: sigma-70 family RNA polymerase sigma factor [Niabella sp.]